MAYNYVIYDLTYYYEEGYGVAYAIPLRIAKVFSDPNAPFEGYANSQGPYEITGHKGDVLIVVAFMSKSGTVNYDFVDNSLLLSGGTLTKLCNLENHNGAGGGTLFAAYITSDTAILSQNMGEPYVYVHIFAPEHAE